MSEIIWLKETDSTNDEVLRRISSLANLSAVATSWQSEGRGQGEHLWHSAAGENLTCSFLLRFPQEGEASLKASGAIFITRIITLSIVDLLSEEGVEAWIKWPNDIWVGEKKICGILIENLVRSGLITESIIGVGLNLNECCFPAELPNPVSLKQLSGCSYDPRLILERLHFHLSVRQGQFFSLSSRDILVESFDRLCKVFQKEDLSQPDGKPICEQSI